MQKEKLTLNNIKKASKDIKVIEATETVLKAIAYTQTMKDIVEPQKRKVLAKYQFRTSQEWVKKGIKKERELITNPKNAYLMNDEDFETYHDEMQQFYKDEGIYPGNNKCPLLVAESMERKAKRRLVDIMEKYTGIGNDDLLMEHYYEYIELNLNFLTQFTRKK